MTEIRPRDVSPLRAAASIDADADVVIGDGPNGTFRAYVEELVRAALAQMTSAVTVGDDVLAEGNVTVTGNTIGLSFGTKTISLGPNTVTSISAPNNRGYFAIFAPYTSSGHNFGIVYVYGAGQYTRNLISSGSGEPRTLDNTILTGSQGEQYYVTVSHVISEQKLYIQNRRGYGLNYSLAFIAT